MIIETLTFDVSGMTERQAYFFAESFRLGIAEFPGVIAHARMRMPNSNRYVVVSTWDSPVSLERFRRSDLYARFLLSPSVHPISDHQDDIAPDAYAQALAA
ncbi:MAG TPA: antibiotic biosynthesis monooxygenase [Tepidiformaceae bacterium]|nr:antibiotic biosynthesis monooxygenase [Tepidiformaceae bacterium]